MSIRNDKNEVTTREIKEIPESIRDLKIETICSIIEVSYISRKHFEVKKNAGGRRGETPHAEWKGL